MSKPLTRRLFAKVAAMAPVAAADVAKEQMAAVGAHVLGSVPPMMPAPAAISGSQASLKLLALMKAGMLPDWAVRIARQRASNSARVLSADVASMRSVSLSSKIRIQEDRNWVRDHINFERDTMDAIAYEKFMGWIR